LEFNIPFQQLEHVDGQTIKLLNSWPLRYYTTIAFPATEHHCSLTITRQYCSVAGAQGYEQVNQSRYTALFWLGVEVVAQPIASLCYP